MQVYGRFNHFGRVHLWLRRESFEAGEASDHWLDPKVDPIWRENPPDAESLARMAGGELVEIPDPGYFSESDSDGMA